MDKMSFASYKFKASDVIEGLNRYFAETKANRYLRVPLEIRNGLWGGYPDCRKDIVFTNSLPDPHTRSGHVCWKFYRICDPEEVVGVAINWLREEHDIFYTPRMNEPTIKDPDDIDDFCVDDATKEYEKATRKDRVEELQESRRDLIEALQKRLHDAKRRIIGLEQGHAEKSKIIDRQKTMIKDLEKQLCEKTEENLDMVPIAKVREALGIAEDSDIFQCIKYRNHQLETLRAEVAVARRRHQRAIEDRDQFGKRLADIRKAAGMAAGDPTDLVKYVEQLREKATEQQKKIESYEVTLSKITDIMEPKYAGPAWSETWDDLVERIKRMKEKVEMLEVAKTDCGLSLKIEELEEQLRVLRYDILEVYREIFDCSNGDPEDTDEETLQDILTEYKRTLELKNVAEEKTIKYKELARENEENLAREREWTKRMGRKLIEIQDICER